MSYRRLPFAEYFINTSEDFNRTGRSTRGLTYTAVDYPCTGKLQRALGLRHEVNFEIHWEADRDVIQINFQRTIGFTDWFANVAEFAANYYDAIEFEGRPLQLRVHAGWAEMYLAAKRFIREQWSLLHAQHPEAETEIVGWSLGSGQAMLCAQDLNYNFGLRSRLITFGSVRPFRSDGTDDAALKRYLGTLCAACWNFADVNDVVTYMPPFKGYTEIRRVELQSAKRSVLRLLNPLRYHTGYDDPTLYRDL
jgi:hypothetical protein